MSEGSETCYKCQELISEGRQKNVFEYQRFIFVFSASGDECADCRKKRCMKFFDDHGKDFIALEAGNNVRVDWSLCLERGQMAKTAELLAALKVLSPCSRGGWLILDNKGDSMNPCTSFEHLYFTRPEDVLKYARLKYSDAKHPWQIVHIDETISREDVVQEE